MQGEAVTKVAAVVRGQDICKFIFSCHFAAKHRHNTDMKKFCARICRFYNHFYQIVSSV